MIVAVVALLAAVIIVATAVARLRVPVFLVLAVVALGFGLVTGRSINAIGRAFGQGFATTIEELGLLLVAGALVAAILGRRPLPRLTAIITGAAAGLGASAGAGLALLQPAVASAPRRAAVAALALLVT